MINEKDQKCQHETWGQISTSCKKQIIKKNKNDEDKDDDNAQNKMKKPRVRNQKSILRSMTSSFYKINPNKLEAINHNEEK